MNFQCKNCGGNMVYSPEKRTMYCPYCDGIDCESVAGDDSLTVCASCGGELNIGQFVSASRCPYCNNYLIFDPRVSGEYKPDRIIPFSVSKKAAVECIEKELKKRTFAPVSFLSEKSLEDMQGYYVPFFLYDFHAEATYEGTGTKVRHWTSGNYDYTETSFYDVRRRMEGNYDNIPVDASTEMDDATMDLIEPYDYNELMQFAPKYLSGFFGEVYNNSSDVYLERAKNKAYDSARKLLHDSISGYTSLRASVDKTELTKKDVDYALFPVWIYKYSFAGMHYPIFVNGQTGKVIGKTPISKLKVFLYAVTGGLLITLALLMLMYVVGVV